MINKRYSRPNFDIYSKSKRSQAHVEIILATTLFIGFLVFVLIFLNSSLKTTKEIPTDQIERVIFGEFKEEVGKLTIVTEPEKCFILDGGGGVNTIYGSNYRIIDEESNRFTIYYGNFLDKSTNTCSSLDKGFKLGAYLEEELIVRANIIDLKNRYESDFSGLKQSLGIDSFAFEFKNVKINPTLNKLVSHWDFEDNFQDVVRGNDGSGVGDPSFTSGIINQAVSLDGDDNIVIPDSPLWDLDGPSNNNDFSLSLWFNANENSFSGDWWEGAFISQDEGPGSKNKWIFTYDNGREEFLFHTNKPGAGSGEEYRSNTFNVNNNEWYHLTFVKSGGNYQFYINGDSIGGGGGISNIPNVNAELSIGHGERTAKFNGLIDDVKIWNDILTSDEIRDLYERNDNTLDVITELTPKAKIPDNIDIISKDFPVRVINEKAEISELILNIKAWR